MQKNIQLSHILDNLQQITFNQVMQQSLHIAQLQNIDLIEFIEEQIENNPFLQKEEASEDLLPSEMRSRSCDNFIEEAESSESLLQKVIAQIYCHINDSLEIKIAMHIVEYLEDTGYVSNFSPSKLAAELQIEERMVDHVIKKLQEFEPSGIFASNLKECLTIQLRDQNLLNDRMKLILDNLELVGEYKIGKLLRITKLSKTELKHYIEIIRSLDPKPGLKYRNSETVNIIPDVYIRGNRRSGLSVELNNSILPRLSLNKEYYLKCKKESESWQFAKEHFQEASNLVKAVAQRENSILKIAKIIAEEQKEFFFGGLAHLKPLTLVIVAEKAELHESTVSRIVNNKFIDSPFGILPFKFFFPRGLENDISSTYIQNRIKKLIDDEMEIMSDEKIAEILSQEGITIARRTITKYREAIGVANSSARKKAKQNKLLTA